MALHPEVQKKAQVELDHVIGPHRLPEHQDLENLPYIQATIMEATRWTPVVPLGVPHAVTIDDVYEGYHIPKGAIVVAVSSIVLEFDNNKSTDYRTRTNGPCFMIQKIILIQNSSNLSDS